MAKGNIFWSQGRGRLGDMVLYIRQGQVIQRKLQAVVTNPRTRLQMIQRARFANAVKFYKKATENFFKFAFEDKRQNESDYNAFMRHNVSNIASVLKRAQVDGNFPALGQPWMITAGSMPADPYVINVGTGIPNLQIPNIAENATTLGEISQGLMDDYYLQKNDIVTIVRVVSSVASLDEVDVPARPVWDIKQFLVNNADTTPITALADYFSATDEGLNLDSEVKTSAAWYGVVFSRRTANGLRVTDSYLYGNGIVMAMWNNARQDAWLDEALETWKTSDDAILEGALAISASTTPVITSASPAQVEAIAQGATQQVQLTGANLGELNAASFVSSDANLTISAYGANADGTSATLTLAASANVTAATISYNGRVFFRVVAAPRTLTVTFEHGTVTANGEAMTNGVAKEFPAGSTINLVATPASGYEFSEWSDGNQNASRSITLDSNTTLEAEFTQA